MKTMRHILLTGMVLIFIGCPARSLFPLFAENNLVFNPGLVGAWIEKDLKQTYFIQKAEGKDYVMIVCNEKGDTSKHIVQLGQLGKFWFLDFFPITYKQDFQILPVHIFSKMRLNGDTLSFASLDNDHLKNIIQTGNVKIPHVILKGEIVLTALTDELQQLVLRVAEDEGAFPKPLRLIRIK